MAEVFQTISDILLLAYNALIAAVPPVAQKFIVFFGMAIFIVIYALLVWKFYESISKKNLFGLNLNKYNTSKHPIITKIFAGMLYTLEYILLLPIMIFIWSVALTVLLVLLSEGIEISFLLLLSATTIGAIRMLSYHNEELAKDVAKIIPLTLLATFLLNINFFSPERILGQIKLIPGVFGSLLVYLVFIIILEFVLRVLDFFISLFQLGSMKIETEDEEVTAEEEEKVKKELAKPAKKKK